ncbi:TetR/AcrR family transcriptional regulator [Aquamicrobium sp. LC103]|uniref:TetR/AcrR family transcriptional regulator n=1 Tax=Aquamicrobium sp. LC103 TaxID=1120658 RepID=UPI00069C66FE|nr:TetR/AcrR family transcriptional regulator [Aquamicrobium sp. LC103]TKT74445.1 TetR/AcrR family transcriptional regulator [Aquamicrobium sp. LC103]
MKKDAAQMGRGAAAHQRTEMRRAQLLEAMAAMMRKGTLPHTLSDLAKAAGMSTATSYRYFQSLDEVAQAYLVKVMTELRDFANSRPETGRELLHVVSRFWINVVMEHGAVLVQIRSRRGFFDRLHGKVASTVRGHEARKRALYGVLLEEGLPVSLQEDAAMLYNTMFDPRDILDLINLRGLDPDRVTDVLIQSFVGALKGWHRGMGDLHPAITAVK